MTGLLANCGRDGSGEPATLLDRAAKFSMRRRLESALSHSLSTWAERFQAATSGWARANGIVIVGSHSDIDTARLRDLGVPFVGSLERARARYELDNR